MIGHRQSQPRSRYSKSDKVDRWLGQGEGVPKDKYDFSGVIIHTVKIYAQNMTSATASHTWIRGLSPDVEDKYLC